jgi:hypothetical protein
MWHGPLDWADFGAGLGADRDARDSLGERFFADFDIEILLGSRLAPQHQSPTSALSWRGGISEL